MLSATDLSVSFGGIHALTGVHVDLPSGQVSGVIGPNGSGKSTLFNCLTGFVQPQSGAVTLDGDSLTSLAPHQRVRRGLARTFQTPRFDPAVTVANSIACGMFTQQRRSLLESALGGPRVRAAERQVERRVTELIDQFKLAHCARLPIGQIPLGDVRLVEVARAMATRPRYLLLDEPAAGLDDPELDVLASRVRDLADTGVGVVLVEHNFDLVTRLCDTITVLLDGALLTHGPPSQIAAHPDVRRLYLGATT